MGGAESSKREVIRHEPREGLTEYLVGHSKDFGFYSGETENQWIEAEG